MLDQLIAKYQARSVEYTRRAQPYALKQELVAKAWLGRAHEADEIVRDLQQLKEPTHGVQRMQAKARSTRRHEEQDRGEAEGAEAGGGAGSTDAAGE
jgi:hypothetical protein